MSPPKKLSGQKKKKLFLGSKKKFEKTRDGRRGGKSKEYKYTYCDKDNNNKDIMQSIFSNLYYLNRHCHIWHHITNYALYKAPSFWPTHRKRLYALEKRSPVKKKSHWGLTFHNFNIILSTYISFLFFFSYIWKKCPVRRHIFFLCAKTHSFWI